jgi:AAA family ATP:ADP antiporter
MLGPIATLRRLTRLERQKAALLFSWFFVTITVLWLLKPIRQASLMVHLGAEELPYVRLGAVVAVAIIVAIYSRLVDRLTRLQIARGASVLFGAVLVAFWLALRIGGASLGAERAFVWAVFILVDIFSTVMIGIFWTYTNDVMTREEADKLYGPIGLGGILGGIAGGLIVDGLVRSVGPVDMLLLCALLMAITAAIVTASERWLHPPARVVEPREQGSALDGARIVMRSPYLLLVVCIVVGYEFAAAMSDWVVSVVLARAYPDEAELSQMFGRLGWIVSGVALVSQLVLVPLLLPRKRIALLIAPLAMGLATVGLAIAPLVLMAFLMSVSDRGLNYSLQQASKETLYVPLTDTEKYKAKAFIDMFVDRAGKALSSIALIIVIAGSGISIPISLAVALGAIALWFVGAAFLGKAYQRRIAGAPERGYTRRANRNQSPVRLAPSANG